MNLIDTGIDTELIRLYNYPIFIAIAEDIGYDKTGRITNNHELDEIGKDHA